MLRTILLTAAAASVAFVGPAVARTTQGGHINGYVVDTIIDSGTYSGTDGIAIYGPHGREVIAVTCSPFNWSSRGPNSQAWVDRIARAWCF